MPPSHDIIIVGAGLAGACAALHLSEDHDVLVLEAATPGAGASGAAAGLVNPLMGRKAKPVWRIDEALDAFYDTLERADAASCFQDTGVLRPTVEEKQVDFFQSAVSHHPDIAEWLPKAAVQDRFPDVHTKGGAIFIPRGGAVDVPAFVNALLDAARHCGAEVQTGARVTGWGEEESRAHVSVEYEDAAPHQIEAQRVLLALGQGYPAHPELVRLGLRGVKGQTVRVRRPDGLGLLIPMSGRGYIVPDGDTLILGSSYEHDFDDLAPSPEATRSIQTKTARMVPGLDSSEVLDVKTGVRVYAADSNLPLIGPLPGRGRCWVFTGLGSKGLLTAPLLARDLPRFMKHPDAIPAEVRME